ncbi:MAG: CapA family protein [Candidatus Limnocylindrales bacterium]
MSVRGTGYSPRQAQPSRPGRGPRWLVPIAAIVLAGGVVVAFAGGMLGGSLPDPSPIPGIPGPSRTPGSQPTQTAAAVDPGESGAPSAAPPTATPLPVATTEQDVAIVPVTNFRSGRTGVRPADVRAIPGGDGTYSALVLVQADADAILAALGTDRAAFGTDLVVVDDADALAANLARNRTRLGFLRADQVGASVRALEWASKALFGVDHVRSLADWPLTARLQAPDAEPGYDPKTAWTLVAGGDILLDRGVALAIKANGVNFPFDGGTVDITGICKDCSPFGWDLPYTQRTGNKGSVRDLVKGADLALANFENPAPDTFRFHSRGTVFSANPGYIKGLRNAGIDWVSLANNHIGDAGRKGILQTMANMDEAGIAHSGVGRNIVDAHKAALLKVGDVTVGLLGYDTIAGYYQAGTTTPGSARLTVKALKADIKAARKAGADLVIVFPHWGVEYRSTPFAGQQRLARAAIDAGADMVIGNHSHWAGAMEVWKGKPIWYALGNFVFDQTWSIPTMEGITLELTFSGTKLVQAKLHPHLIMDKAQPNFLDPLGDGRTVLSQIFRASKGLLSW